MKPLIGGGLMLEPIFSVVRYLRADKLLRITDRMIFGVNCIGVPVLRQAVIRFAHLG